MKVLNLSALGTSRPYPPGTITGTYFCLSQNPTQGHSAAGRIMPMKNSSDILGAAGSAVPQPTALSRALQVRL